MRIRPFVTEGEKDLQAMAHNMSLDAAGQELNDARLAYSIAQNIRYQLPKVHQKYLDMESVMNLSKMLADLVDDYDFIVMPFNELMKVLHEQPGVIIKVGIPSKKTPFALIDERTRVVGVYVPKKPRLVYIEKEAWGAVQALNEQFQKMGATIQPDVEDALRKIFAGYEHYPYHIPPMRVIPKINESFEGQSFFSKTGREICYRISHTRDEVILEYYIFQ